MFESDFHLALRTLWHLVAWRWPAFVCFWLAAGLGIEAVAPLGLALTLHLSLRMSGNMRKALRNGLEVPKLVWPFLAAAAMLPLTVDEATLMVLWSAGTAVMGLLMWWWSDLRQLQAGLHAAPIEDADLWLDIRTGAVVATGAFGLILSLFAGPAVWLVGILLAAAAFDLTVVLYAAADEQI